MQVWTEIINEKVAAVHFECDDYRYKAVAVPLEENVNKADVVGSLAELGARAVRRQYVRQGQKVREHINQRRNAREIIKRAGYDPDEIPL